MPSEAEYLEDRALNQTILDCADDLLTDVLSLTWDSEYVAVQKSRLDALRAAIEAKWEAVGR